ncbi:MAG: DUF58 domain-containing protein [Pseudomonadota bacterium]|nr:DUF58 domain-containing protein [Pseudomonadota bacterium]
MMRWFRHPAELPHAVPNPPAPPQPAPESAEHLLRRLEWTVLRRLDGVLQGDWRTFLRGSGLDLADLREYQPHDDVRHIDWNVTARQQQPHVRVFTEDREMTAWFLLDLSGSVDFGSGSVTKRQVSRAFVGVLARLFTRRGNRVGALLYGTGVERVVPAHASRAHVLRLLHAMQPDASKSIASRASGSSAKAQKCSDSTPAGTQLSELLLAAASVLRRRSTVFVVSDFISAPGWEKPLARLALRHDVVAVHLTDPLELALPDLGLVTLRDAETGEQMLVDTHSPAFRDRFAAIARQREAALTDALAFAGVDALALSTADDLAESLLRFADLRRQRARLAAGGGLPAHLRPTPRGNPP